MKTRAVWLLLGAAIVLLALIAWIVRPPSRGIAAAQQETAVPESHGEQVKSEPLPPEPDDPAVSALFASITSAASALQALPPMSETERKARAEEVLRQLKAALSSGALSASVAAILEYLASGSNAASGLPFRVGEGGSLESAPTLRAFLLDLLGTLDPIAAADYSRKHLNASTGVPEEMALAMRNLVWGSGGSPGAGDRSLIQSNVEGLLGSDGWRQNPSTSYLESFDAAVFLADPATTAQLAGVVAERGASSAAALLALERIAQSGNPELLAEIASPASPLATQPAFRAELLARAEVADPAAREVVERYLTDPGIPVQEKELFLKAFPLRSQTEGPRLITESVAPANLPALDQAAVEVLRTWKDDPAFRSVQPGISAAIERIEEYLR